LEGNGEAGQTHENEGQEQSAELGEAGEHDEPSSNMNGDAPEAASTHFEQPREPEPYRSTVREEPAPEAPLPAPAAAEPAPSNESAKPARRGWWNRLTEG